MVTVTKPHTWPETRHAQAQNIVTHSMWECRHKAYTHRFCCLLVSTWSSDTSLVRWVCIVIERPAETLNHQHTCGWTGLLSVPNGTTNNHPLTHDLNEEIQPNKQAKFTTLSFLQFFLKTWGTWVVTKVDHCGCQHWRRVCLTLFVFL